MEHLQRRNSALVGLLSADLQNRREPNFALANTISAYLSIPALRAFYPCGAQRIDDNNNYIRDLACGYDLTNNGGRLVYDRLAPTCLFLASTSAYATYADNAQFDITGTEASVEFNGLTFGGWFNFRSFPASGAIRLMNKAVPNQVAYYLSCLNATGRMYLGISQDGILTAGLTALEMYTGISTDAWFYVVGRFRPGVEMKLWVCSPTHPYTVNTTTNVIGSIFNSSSAFEVARYNVAPPDRYNYYDGQTSMLFVAASALSDGMIDNLWHTSRYLYI